MPDLPHRKQTFRSFNFEGMNNNPHLKTVRDAVILACPDIMELKYGCRIIHYYDHFDGSHEEESIVTSKNGNEIQVFTKPHSIVTVKEFNEEDFEVLGRPITLANVLSLLVNRKNPYDRTAENKICTTVYSWDLTNDDLNLQSEATLEFLAGVFSS